MVLNECAKDATLPAEIKQRLQRLRYRRSTTRPRHKVKLSDVAQFTCLNVAYCEVTDDEIIRVDV